ncbi:MAG: hypothetical protein ACO3JL_08315, partial [Myxococcota bacterium]
MTIGGVAVFHRARCRAIPRRGHTEADFRNALEAVDGDATTVLNAARLTQKDTTGVLVALHAFEALVVKANEYEKQNSGVNPKLWNAIRENDTPNQHFKTLPKTPVKMYDFEYTFKKRVKKALKPGANQRDIIQAIDSLPKDPVNTAIFLDDIGAQPAPPTNRFNQPKWLNPKKLKEEFWKDCTYQCPDGVLLITYIDNSDELRKFRVFLEVD